MGSLNDSHADKPLTRTKGDLRKWALALKAENNSLGDALLIYANAWEAEVMARSSDAPALTDREPAGYVAIMNDKDAPKGYWYIGAYHDQSAALIAAGKQQASRVEPFYVATNAELAAMVNKALSASARTEDQICVVYMTLDQHDRWVEFNESYGVAGSGAFTALGVKQADALPTVHQGQETEASSLASIDNLNAAPQAQVGPAGVPLCAQAGSIPVVDGSSPSPAVAAPSNTERHEALLEVIGLIDSMYQGTEHLIEPTRIKMAIRTALMNKAPRSATTPACQPGCPHNAGCRPTDRHGA